MTTFLAILGLIVASGAAWIGYLALKLSHQAHRTTSTAKTALRPATSSLDRSVARAVRRLQDAPVVRPVEFRDIQMSMRVALAIGGFQRRLPVTVILSERSFAVPTQQTASPAGSHSF